MVAYGQLRNWKADSVDAAGEELRSAGSSYDRIADTVRMPTDVWTGLNSTTATLALSVLRGRLSDHADAVLALEREAYRASQAIASMRTAIETAEGLAARHEFCIDDSGVVRDVGGQRTFADPEDATDYTRQRQATQQEILGYVEDALRKGYALDAALATAIWNLARAASGDRDPDERDGRRVRNDERFRVARDGNSHDSNDWAGRSILERYLTGGDDWTIQDDPTWTAYLEANDNLRHGFTDGRTSYPGLDERTDSVAEAALRAYLSGGPSVSSFDDTFHQAVENGEGIVGYQYLHGTDREKGDFRHSGSTSITPRGNGTYEVRIDASYQWNDTIDPNPQYSTDRWKSTLAEVMTLGRADPYTIHIGWTEPTTLIVDADGTVVSRQGWP